VHAMSQQYGLCGLERSQARGPGAATDLEGGQRRGSKRRTAGLCHRLLLGWQVDQNFRIDADLLMEVYNLQLPL
jgi:hypothetical protein